MNKTHIDPLIWITKPNHWDEDQTPDYQEANCPLTGAVFQIRAEGDNVRTSWAPDTDAPFFSIQDAKQGAENSRKATLGILPSVDDPLVWTFANSAVTAHCPLSKADFNIRRDGQGFVGTSTAGGVQLRNPFMGGVQRALEAHRRVQLGVSPHPDDLITGHIMQTSERMVHMRDASIRDEIFYGQRDLDNADFLMDEMNMTGTTRLAHREEMSALRETVSRFKAELEDRAVRRERGEDPEASVPKPDDRHDPDIPF